MAALAEKQELSHGGPLEHLESKRFPDSYPNVSAGQPGYLLVPGCEFLLLLNVDPSEFVEYRIPTHARDFLVSLKKGMTMPAVNAAFSKLRSSKVGEKLVLSDSGYWYTRGAESYEGCRGFTLDRLDPSGRSPIPLLSPYALKLHVYFTNDMVVGWTTFLMERKKGIDTPRPIHEAADAVRRLIKTKETSIRHSAQPDAAVDAVAPGR